MRRMCSALSVSAGGYYAWRQRPESARSLRHRHLTEKIRESFEASDQTCGAVRICHDLREAKERVGKNTAALLMRRNHLVPRPVRRFRVTTDSRHTQAMPHVLNREFAVAQANRKWVSDITAVPTREGWLYVCVVLDLYSRAVAGWAMTERGNRFFIKRRYIPFVERFTRKRSRKRTHQTGPNHPSLRFPT